MPELFREHRKDKTIVFFDKLNDKVICYNGKEHDDITFDEFIQIIRKPYDHPFILVKLDRGADIYNCKKEYRRYKKSIKNVKKISGVNMFRTGSVSNTALSLFYKSIDHKKLNTQPVQDYEFKYLLNGGGVRIGHQYTGTAYKYDVNSYYPSLYLSKIIKIPLRAGTLTTINNINDMEYVPHGIYNVKIDIQDHKLFTENKKDIYTHYELNWAKKLNYDMKVMGQHMIYDKECLISMHDLFHKFVDKLYKHKKEDKMFKLLINCLWGALVSKSGGSTTIRGTIDHIDNTLEKYGGELQSLIEYKDDIYEAVIHKDNTFYRTNYARLNPFLLGYARCKIHKDIMRIGSEHVYYVHTDGIITDTRITDELPITDKIGDYKYEGKSTDCVIYNANTYTF